MEQGPGQYANNSLKIILLAYLLQPSLNIIGVVYLAIEPNQGVNILRYQQQFYSIIDSDSYQAINKFRYQAVHQPRHFHKPLPQIPMLFGEINLPKVLRFELTLQISSNRSSTLMNNKQVEGKVQLYLKIVPIAGLNRQKPQKLMNTPCIYLQWQREEQQYQQQKEQRNYCHYCQLKNTQTLEYQVIYGQLQHCLQKLKNQNLINQFLGLNSSQYFMTQSTKITKDLHIYQSLFKVFHVILLLGILIAIYHNLNTNNNPSQI